MLLPTLAGALVACGGPAPEPQPPGESAPSAEPAKAIEPLTVTEPAVNAEIHIDGKPITVRRALAVSSAQRPGRVEIYITDAEWTCEQVEVGGEIGDKHLLVLQFDAMSTGAVASQAAMLPRSLADAPLGGSATLVRAPTARGESGSLTLAFEAGGHAKGEQSFTMCTDYYPYVAPSSAWTPTEVDVSVPSTFTGDPPKTIAIRMPFPTEWTKQEPQPGTEASMAWKAQDGRTALYLKLHSPWKEDPAGQFKAWADDALIGKTEVARTFDGEVGTLEWTRKTEYISAHQVEVLVQRPGFEHLVHCVLSVPEDAPADIVPATIKACSAIQKR